MVAQNEKSVLDIVEKLERKGEEGIFDMLTVHRVIAAHNESIVFACRAVDVEKNLRKIPESVGIITLHMNIGDDNEIQLRIIRNGLIAFGIYSECNCKNKAENK